MTPSPWLSLSVLKYQKNVHVLTKRFKALRGSVGQLSRSQFSRAVGPLARLPFFLADFPPIWAPTPHITTHTCTCTKGEVAVVSQVRSVHVRFGGDDDDDDDEAADDGDETASASAAAPLLLVIIVMTCRVVLLPHSASTYTLLVPKM